MRMLTPWTAAWITAALVLTASVIAASTNSNTRCRGTACAAAKRHAHSESSVLGMGPLLSAGNDPPLRPVSLLVRSLLTASRAFFQSFEVIDQARPPLGSFRSQAAAWFAVRCNPTASGRAAR
jgi:hypothetical protein